MTAEVSFAQSFLAALDSKPIKLPTDYAVDPKTFQPKGPYTLPRQSPSMTRPSGSSSSSAPGSSPGLTVTLKSLRNPPLDLSLPGQPLTTSVLELKQKVATELGTEGTDKIRILYRKKPCADSKSVKDVVGDEGGKGPVDFSVMVMGWVAKEKEADTEKEVATGGDTTMVDAAPVAQGESGASVMQAKEFWADLRHFLEQRVRDSQVAERAVELFEQVWKEKGELLP